MRRRVEADYMGAELVAYRQREGLSQAVAAAWLDVSRAQWARWERNEVAPDPYWRQRLQMLLGGEAVAVTAADVLRDYQRIYGLTQVEAAERLNVSRRAYQAWLAGVRPRGWRKLRRNVAAAVGDLRLPRGSQPKCNERSTEK